MLHYDSRRLDEFVDNWSLCFPMLTSLDFTWNRFLDDAMLISIAQTMCHKQGGCARRDLGYRGALAKFFLRSESCGNFD